MDLVLTDHFRTGTPRGRPAHWVYSVSSVTLINIEPRACFFKLKIWLSPVNKNYNCSSNFWTAGPIAWCLSILESFFEYQESCHRVIPFPVDVWKLFSFMCFFLVPSGLSWRETLTENTNFWTIGRKLMCHSVLESAHRRDQKLFYRKKTASVHFRTVDVQT